MSSQHGFCDAERPKLFKRYYFGKVNSQRGGESRSSGSTCCKMVHTQLLDTGLSIDCNGR